MMSLKLKERATAEVGAAVDPDRTTQGVKGKGRTHVTIAQKRRGRWVFLIILDPVS